MKFKITIKSKNFNQCAMNSFLYFLAIRVDYNPGQNILEHDRNLQILQFQPPSPQSQCWNWANFEKKSLSKPTLSSGGGGRTCGRRNLWNFCVCSIYFVRNCLKIWECRLRRFLMFWLCILCLATRSSTGF